MSLRATAFAACPHPLVPLGLSALFLISLVPTLFLVWAKEVGRGWGQPSRCQRRRRPRAPGGGLRSGSRPRSPPITTLDLGSSTRPGATGLPSGSQATGETPQQPAALPGPSTGLPQGPRPPPAPKPAGLLCLLGAQPHLGREPAEAVAAGRRPCRELGGGHLAALRKSTQEAGMRGQSGGHFWCI